MHCDTSEDCQCESGKSKMEVRMSISSLGDGSVTLSVNIPKKIEERMMKICSREDTNRSQVARAALVLGLPILESIAGMPQAIDPGGRDCPCDG